MKIGISDYMTFARSDRLLKEGHQVFYTCDLVPVDDDFKATHVRRPFGTNNVVQTFHGPQISVELDVVDTDTSVGQYTLHKEWTGQDPIGWSPAAILHESNREVARRALTQHRCPINIPKVWFFYDKQTFIDTCKDFDSFVVKPFPGFSAQQYMSAQVITDVSSFISSLDSHSPICDEGVEFKMYVEEFIEGYEMNLGCMFDGSKFQGPYYCYIEQKEPTNGGRTSNLTTGEVGTIMIMQNWGSNPVAEKLLRSIEPIFAGKGKGMLDINTITDKSGNMYFIEYTVRHGNPTSAVMDSALKPKANYGEYLKGVQDGYFPASSLGFDVYEVNKWYIGITTFTYGYSEMTVGNLLPKAVEYDLPEEFEGFKVVANQATYEENGRFSVPVHDRLFVVTGEGYKFNEAVETAYKGLANYRADGVTWRDDIGKPAVKTFSALKQLGILNLGGVDLTDSPRFSYI